MRKIIGKRNKTFYVDETKKYKLVKSNKGWLVIGLSILGMAGLFGVENMKVQAAEWTPNSVEQIANRIQPGQTSLEFQWGDTVWNIGLALNIKDPMQLLYDNGFKNGEQYSIQVGTIITWDGNHVTVTDPSGEVIGDSVVTNEQKHDPNKTIANQESDTPKNFEVSSTDSGNSNSHRTSVIPGVSSDKGSGSTSESKPTPTPNPDGSAGGNGEGGEKPKPKPTPIPDPEPTPEQTELEKLQAHLADLKQQLTIAEQELVNAQKALEAAQNSNVDELRAEVEKQQAVVDEANQAVQTKEQMVAELQSQLESAQAAAERAQTALDATVPEFNEKQQAATNAATALTTATQTHDALVKQWTDKYPGIDPTKDESRDTDPTLFDQIKSAKADVDTATATKTQADADFADIQEVVKNMQDNVVRRQAVVDGLNIQIATAKKEVETAKATVQTETAELQDLQKQLEDAQAVDINALEQAVKDAQAKVDDLKKQIKDTEAKIADIQLKVDRQKAVNQVKAFTYLTQELKDGYIARINKTLTVDEIKSIVSEASAKNDELKAQWEAEEAARKLQEAKDEAVKVINALSHLSEDEKSAFLDQVNNAETVEAVKTVQANAEKVNADNKTLAEAQTAAIKAVSAMSYLTVQEKNDFVAQIKVATTVADVTAVQSKADGINAERKALAQAKEKATTAINQMQYLSKSEKAGFTDRVATAKAIDEVSAIQSEASKLNEQHKEEAEQARLEALREEAKATINGLRYLSASEKQGFIDQLPNAKTDKAIEQIVTNAKTKNEENHQAEIEAAELEELRENSINDVNAMKWLSTGEKSDFVAQLKAATTKADVVKILNAAKAQDEANEQAHLTAVYNQAKADINGLSYLSTSEKDGFLKQLDAVKNSEAQMKAVVDNAKALNESNKEALELAKADAIDTINGLTFLSEARRNTYIGQVNSTTSTSQISTIVEKAVAENEDAKELDTYKDDAIAEAKQLTNISESQLNGAISAINSASTKSEVKQILDDLKALDEQIAEEKLKEAKKDAKTAIDNLEFLLPSQKNDFKDQVDAAKSIEAIEQIVKDASKQNDIEKNKGTLSFTVFDTQNNKLLTIEKRIEAGDYKFTLDELGIDSSRYVLISGELSGLIKAQETKMVTVKVADKKKVETIVIKALDSNTGEIIKTVTLYVLGGENVTVSSSDLGLNLDDWELIYNVTYPTRLANPGETTEYEYEFERRTPYLDDEQTQIAISTLQSLINEYRIANGLDALTFDAKIASAASIRAQEVIESASHTRPDGSRFNTALDEAGVNYNIAGENIATTANKIHDGKEAANRLFTQWKNSPEHNAAMLSRSYSSFAVGLTSDKNGIYGVTLFTGM